MSRFRLAWSSAIGILLVLGASGCFPSGDSPLDEQKEPHFITGKNLATQMDYQGAIVCFEKALEVNPRSASAHFELAYLYECKAQTADPAAAIYHYDRFLKLSPKSDKADLIRSHINSCKLELAKAASSFSPWPASAQHDMETLMIENKDLKARLAQYEAATATRTPAVIPPPAQTPTRTTPLPSEPARSMTPTTSYVSNTRSSSNPRTHTIKSGENPSSIAKQYGISTASLMAANPQARANHLQVGQTLNVPAP